MNTTQYTVCVVGDKTGKTIFIEQFVSGDLNKIPKDNGTHSLIIYSP